MADLNFVLLTGVSTKDAALRHKLSDQVKAEFSFEVDRPFTRPDGEPVSDLFLVDAWGKLAQWAAEHVRVGTRLMIVGTLNKESYKTRGGAKEHITVVKAKHLELLPGVGPAAGFDTEAIRRDSWELGDILRHLRLVTRSLEREAAEAVAS